MDLESRLKRLEGLVPADAGKTRWDDFDEAARGQMAHLFLAAVEALHRADQPGAKPKHPASEATMLAGLDAVDALEARLAAEGLLYGPLDDAQRTRLAEIGTEARRPYEPSSD